MLCHPHPRHGESKDHPLLWAIRNDLAAARGFAVLGFNFRGVMGSQGSYGGGRDELRDVRAAVTTLREPTPARRCPVLVRRLVVRRLAWRSARRSTTGGSARSRWSGMPLRPGDLSLPPLPDAADLRALRRPALLVAGEHDEYCPADELRDYAAAFPDASVTIVPGTDHYFWRRERDAAETVGTFATDRLLARALGRRSHRRRGGPGGRRLRRCHQMSGRKNTNTGKPGITNADEQARDEPRRRRSPPGRATGGRRGGPTPGHPRIGAVADPRGDVTLPAEPGRRGRRRRPPRPGRPRSARRARA